MAASDFTAPQDTSVFLFTQTVEMSLHHLCTLRHFQEMRNNYSEICEAGDKLWQGWCGFGYGTDETLISWPLKEHFWVACMVLSL